MIGDVPEGQPVVEDDYHHVVSCENISPREARIRGHVPLTCQTLTEYGVYTGMLMVDEDRDL